MQGEATDETIVPFMKQSLSQFGARRNTAPPRPRASRHAFHSSTFLQADPAADARDPRPSFDPPGGCLVRGSTRVHTDEGAESTHRATAWVVQEIWGVGIQNGFKLRWRLPCRVVERGGEAWQAKPSRLAR